MTEMILAFVGGHTVRINEVRKLSWSIPFLLIKSFLYFGRFFPSLASIKTRLYLRSNFYSLENSAKRWVFVFHFV